MDQVFFSTIGETLLGHGERNPAAVAILHPGVAPLTFGDLAKHYRQFEAQLRDAGIGPASRVAVVLPRSPEAALLSVAVSGIATMVPLNPGLAPADLASELAGTRPDAVIVSGAGETPAWAHSFAGVFRLAPVLSTFDDVALQQVTPVAARQAPGPVTEQSVSAIFRTSGTTGNSKRVPVTHGNLIEMARKMRRWLSLTSADRSACVLPIYYNAGFKATLLAPLLNGCSVAMPASAGVHEIDGWLGDLRPTWLTAAPALLQAMLERLRERNGEPLEHSLRFVLSTASYLSEAIRVELESLIGVPVVEFYGLSEAGIVTAPALPPTRPKPGTVGRIPEGELAIRGDNGSLLPAGQTGQVVVRGPSVTPGYISDVDDVPGGLDNGWLVTGDLGSVDSEGFLTIVGRTKEIINRGGEKVSPYDVEKALLLHPAVREAAAFAIPHPRLGENVAAAVVLKSGAEVTSSILIDFLYDRLAPYQMPRHVHVRENLPLGATGKISRPALAAHFAAQPRVVTPPEQPLQIQIAEVWQRYIGRSDIGLDDDFFEIGGDSLQATEMLLELEEVTRQSIPPSEIRAELTIRNLAQTLVRAATSDLPVTRVRDGQGTPLFLCHGDFDGWGLYAFRLVQLLKHDGPIYLLHSNLDAASRVMTIEEMVQRYLPHLLAAWPRGAFRLAGYCHGGLAAWELAHRLGKIGRDVDCVVMIDTFSINARPVVRSVLRAVDLVSSIFPEGKREALRDKVMPSWWSLTRRLLHRDASVFRRAMRRLSGVSPGGGQPATNGGASRWDYYKAMSKYLPPSIDTNVVCVLSDDYSTKAEYSPDVWRRLAPSLSYETVPGDHATCITTHVTELASTLNRHLEPA